MLRTDFDIRWLSPWLGLAIAIVAGSSAFGQTAADAPPADVRFLLETTSRFGNLTYLPEQWGELHLRLENRGETPRDLLCTTYAGDQQTLQFGRRVWLPARSRLSVSHPVLLPKATDSPDQPLALHSLVIDQTQGNDVLVKDESGQLRHDRPLQVAPPGRHTGILAGWSADAFVPEDVSDLVIAGRVSQGLSNKITVLGGQFLPADETSLKYLDHLVIAENRLADDEAALAAVRRWLHAGGRLWVMLDRADPQILERLLGDDFEGHLVDRVGLTSVRIDEAPTLAAPNGSPGATAEYDEPVEFARMAISGMNVWNTVNGWPAAMTCSFGDGRLLITTLGPRGWIKPRPVVQPKGNDPAPVALSPYVPNSPMEDLSAYVLAQRAPEVLPPGDLEKFAQEHVSYQVPTWTLIVATMGGFLLSLFLTAAVLYRLDCLEHFGWGGSLLAMIFGVVLTGFGLSSRYGVPGTMASVQVARAIRGTNDVRTHGAIAVYRPEGTSSPIQTSRGGELWPDMTGAEGATRRMITTDLGAFHWDGLPQPAGLRMYADAASSSSAQRIEARATLNAEGVAGQYSGQSAAGADALLATRYGRVGVTMSPDGSFTAKADDVFGADQYLNANFLGDEQDRRRRILQELFASPTWKESLERPQLLVWVDEWDPGFQFGDGLTRQGETLLAVPVEMVRPPSGAELLIPPPLLSYATRRPPDGSLAAGFWDDLRKEWQERSNPSVTWLSFQIPRELLPLKATKARLDMKVSGPMGRLEILGIKENASVSLAARTEPTGTLAFEIEDAEVLAVSDRGELSLGIGVGDPTKPAAAMATGSTANYWRIESLGLQVWAKAAERSDKD